MKKMLFNKVLNRKFLLILIIINFIIWIFVFIDYYINQIFFLQPDLLLPK